MTTTGAVGVVAALAFFIIAQVVPVPASAAPKAATGTVSLTVKVSNGRTVPVTTLSLVPTGTEPGANLLKKPLPPGQSVSLVVKARKGECLFDVSGGYEDEVEIAGSGLNLCRDKAIALVD
jgi:hypothetical protein